MPPKKIDLAGKKYGKLLVIEFSHKGDYGCSMWLCQCECGSMVKVQAGLLNSGKNSCGCSNRAFKHLNAKKGQQSYEYRCFYSMKRRCYNQTTTRYKDYGGRGIKICERWVNSFENFLSDMGKRPSSLHSLDRIDNNGDYSPQNCKWSTAKEQISNRRSSVMLVFNGEKISLTDFANLVDRSPTGVRRRIFKLKESPEEAYKWFVSRKKYSPRKQPK